MASGASLRPFTVDHCKAFCERLVLDTGENWVLEDFQLEIFEPVLAGVREVWTVIPEGSGKCLDVQTPLPTPDGWTTMLDVKRGDWLLGSGGQPVLVGYVSEVKLGSDCYRLTFSDGSTIVCDGSHRWRVEDAQNDYKSSVRTTEWLASRVKIPKKNGWDVSRWRIPKVSSKAQRLRTHGCTTDHRWIVAIDRVPTRPVKCVEVQADDHLYLAGEAFIPTHNTTMMAGFSLYHCMFVRQPWVPIVASSRDQAEILARQAYGMIRETKGLEYNSKTKRGYFRIYEGYREIRAVQNGGRGIKVYAADAATSDGGIPTLVLCDEGHRWPDLGVYRLWKGKLGKRDGQILMISTAGEPGGDFEETCDHIQQGAVRCVRNGAHSTYYGPGIVLNKWAVEDPQKINDMQAVKAANPFSGVTIQGLSDEFNSLTLDLGMWKRLKCNLPSRSVAAAITDVEWAKAYIDLLKELGLELGEMLLPAGVPVDLGADVAWKHDTFAWVPISVLEGKDQFYNVLGKATILEPPRDGSTMHPDVPKRAFEAIHDLHEVGAVVMDMERAEDIAAWLEDEHGVEVIDRPQGNANHVQDYDAFMKGLRNGTLRHTGDPGLAKHAKNAIARTLPGDRKRFDRPSQSRAKRKQEVRVIDALTAAGMVNHYRGEPMVNNEPLVFWR